MPARNPLEHVAPDRIHPCQEPEAGGRMPGPLRDPGHENAIRRDML